LFVCENNLYAESTPVEYSTNIKNIAERAAAYTIPGVTVDGMDVFAVYEAALKAARRARGGEGPSLIEAKTYRYYGHFEGDSLKYRSRDEEQMYRARDPIAGFERRVLAEKVLTSDELEQIEKRAQAMLEAAIEFAEASPYPDPEQCLTDVYVSYR
jgi:pyruvate dehydrogenase E1 component alpha subunit